MNVPELKNIWLKEKEHYLKSEIGSGVQDFVYQVFQCAELFGLNKGLKSTPLDKRALEFLLEETDGKSGRADAVIFIDQDIIIPVEVEKLNKAKSGEWQILKYRTAFDKKYGILTDGYEWRFYYGEIEEEAYYLFNIDKMLGNPEGFKLFWKEYIEPENYYLSFFEEVGQQQKLELFGVEKLAIDTHRTKFFNDITDVIKKLKNKLQNAGFLVKIENEFERDKKATEIAYSYLIQFILYKTLVDNVFLEFDVEFEKKEKLIHQNLKKKSYNSILMILEGMSAKISENIYKPFHNEQELILEQVKTLLHAGSENLMSVTPFLDIFVFIRKYNFANVQNDIFGAIYENYLKELFEESNLGQYFTAPEVVDFMLKEIGYTKEEIESRNHQNISIIDPSCGSGTFLYSAVRELMSAGKYNNLVDSSKIEEDIINNIFGLDISEFPLYLAEMSVLMKVLPMVAHEKYNNPIDKKLKLFVTEDSVSEFLGEIGGRKSNDGDAPRLALEWKYEGFMRDERDLDDMKKSLNTVGSGKSVIMRKRFDYVIGNPPYISYNDCAKKLNTKVIKCIQDSKSNIKMSDIFGYNLNTVPGRRKTYPPKPNLYAFFIALGIALLKEGGVMSYIIPQTILTANDLDVLRYILSKEVTLQKMFIFSGKMFLNRGVNQKKPIATSSLIFTLKKKKPNAQNMVDIYVDPQIADGNEDVSEIIKRFDNKDILTKKTILQKKLFEEVDNWNFIYQKKEIVDFLDSYKRKSDSFDVYRLFENAVPRFGAKFYFDVGFILDEDRIHDFKNSPDDFEILDFKHFDGFSNFKPQKYYPNKKEFIHLTRSNQGHITLNPKYKIIWRIKNTQGFKLTDRPIIFNMGRASIISSDNKEEMEYLLSILNSPISELILVSYLKIVSEKEYLVPILPIKKYIRPPLINSPEKKAKKQKIIELTGKMIAMEKQTLGNLLQIDTLLQRFSYAEVKEDKLFLIGQGTELSFPIKAGDVVLVKNSLEKLKISQKLLIMDESSTFTLTQLKELSAYDKEEQINIKKQIDEFIFDLYDLSKEEREIISNFKTS